MRTASRREQGVASVVRRATEVDAAALAELAEQTFRDTFAHANSPEDMEAHCRRTCGVDVQAEEIRDRDRVTLVCEADGHLVGYGQLRRGAAPACVAGERPAEIQRLYVDARWHGKGVAQALMASLRDAAAAGGAEVIWLGVWERNPRAIAFYEKSGFTVAGERAIDFRQGDPIDGKALKDLVRAAVALNRAKAAPKPKATPRPKPKAKA